MCDYSAKGAKTRAAAKNDRLVTQDISAHTRGFVGVEDDSTAVCLLPGTELKFESEVLVDKSRNYERQETGTIRTGQTTAIFRQVDKDNEHAHHDALELADGSLVMLDYLLEGQHATVLQLPAAPTSPKEREAQKRAEYA